MGSKIKKILLYIVTGIIACISFVLLILWGGYKPSKKDRIKPLQTQIDNNNIQAEKLNSDVNTTDSKVNDLSISVDDIAEKQKERDNDATILFPNLDKDD